MNRMFLLARTFFILPFVLQGCGIGRFHSHLDLAEKYKAVGSFREAISEYELHIQEKLKHSIQEAKAVNSDPAATQSSVSSPSPSIAINTVSDAALLKQSAVPPYFFSLIVGDLYLKLDDPIAARASYLQAKENGVDPSLVAHKIRYLGHWYEDQGKPEEAMAIYTEFNELDPLLFDMDKDRLYKIKLEQRNRERMEKE